MIGKTIFGVSNEGKKVIVRLKCNEPTINLDSNVKNLSKQKLIIVKIIFYKIYKHL